MHHGYYFVGEDEAQQWSVNLDDVGDNMVTINDILELRPSWWKYKLTNALKFRKAYR